eukprot:CCRYP_002236-RA/>CCRYP_002236-RA protein AED:0.00 eAED:0.00 QI:28/-1/1/1/-1/1/1/226/425
MNMNLDTFRSRVAQSAVAAATAARQFSSLDEMAQNDDYVQSEGLNVSNKKKEHKHGVAVQKQLESSSLVENLSEKFVETLSTAAKPKSRSTAGEVVHKTSYGSKEVKKPVASGPKLVSSVAALYKEDGGCSKHSKQREDSGDKHYKTALLKTASSGRNHVAASRNSSLSSAGVILVNDRHAHILHQLNYDSDNDSSDNERVGNSSNNADEIELRRTNSLSDELERELNETLQKHKPTEEAKKKDPHRFMIMTADLEKERESLLQSQSMPQANHGMANSAGLETSSAIKAGLSWVKNVASPQLQALSKHIMTKVAEKESHRYSTTQKEEQSIKPMIGPRHTNVSKMTDSLEDEIIMTSSAAFLVDEDHAELERIRSMHSSSRMTALLRSCLDGLWGNPRLAFVAATLIVALLVYYYSRKRSVDDVF